MLIFITGYVASDYGERATRRIHGMTDWRVRSLFRVKNVLSQDEAITSQSNKVNIQRKNPSINKSSIVVFVALSNPATEITPKCLYAHFQLPHKTPNAIECKEGQGKKALSLPEQTWPWPWRCAASFCVEQSACRAARRHPRARSSSWPSLPKAPLWSSR